MEIKELVGLVTGGLALFVSALSVAGAFKAGVLKRVRFGAFEIEAASEEAQKLRAALESKINDGREIPFEIEQLTNYYSQILTQSKISFWFSLVFASLGFAIIVMAAFLYSDGSGTATVPQFIAGTIMDVVAGLFFVQSRNAQKSMANFFDKLRNDRLHMESRRLVDTISSENAKDALRLHLSLHYAGITGAEKIAEKITSSCLAGETYSQEQNIEKR